MVNMGFRNQWDMCFDPVTHMPVREVEAAFPGKIDPKQTRPHYRENNLEIQLRTDV